MDLHVETADAQPTHFSLGGQRLAVEVLDRWPGENYIYFKVRASDDNLYILRRDDPAGAWTLTLFQAEASADRSIGKPRGHA
jgi:hypothetical protein